MKYKAYWISPVGTVIPVEHRHIETVTWNPELFGLTRRKVQAVFKKYGEPVPFEGHAREEILGDLIKKGWLRIRYRGREDSFTVQVFRYNAGARKRLKKARHGEP